jgi:intracellular septation protein
VHAMLESMSRKIIVNWLIEFGPIISFFLALHFLGDTDSGFITATSIFSVLTAVALIASYYYEKRIAIFPLIAGTSVIFFGVITFVFKNPLLFILKDTFYNGGFAIFLLSGAFFNKGFLKLLFITLFDISDRGWYILSLRWGIFFLFLAISNEFIWRMYGQDVWIGYKFWATIITAVFGFYQITLSRKYRNPTATVWGMRKG